MNHIDVGELGEALARLAIRNLGRDTRVPKRTKVGDFHTGSLRVEVKTARLRKVNQTKLGWQFCIRRDGHTDAGHAHILLLIGLDESHHPEKVYIVPVADLEATRKKINIVRESANDSKWALYENRFDLIAEIEEELG